MATGACGISCDACRLYAQGICSSCGPGGTGTAQNKLKAQTRVLGAACPVLACALEKGVVFCPRDCDGFPCDKFRTGPYPYSDGYLAMQERRRREMSRATTPSGEDIKVPPQYWDDLKGKDITRVCDYALVRNYAPTGLLVPFLKEYLLVDMQNHCLSIQGHGKWDRIANPLLELLCLVYLINAGPEPVSQQMVSVKELKSAHFFTSPHDLRIEPLSVRYGHDLDGFKRAAEKLGGESIDQADAAYRLLPFPKVPLYYLLWKGDEEFPPIISVLFDRSIEHHLRADAIWGLVNLVSALLLSPEREY